MTGFRTLDLPAPYRLLAMVKVTIREVIGMLLAFLLAKRVASPWAFLQPVIYKPRNLVCVYIISHQAKAYFPPVGKGFLSEK